MLSSTLLASVLESAPDAIVIVDSVGTILFASRRITALCGYLPEEIVGQGIECLLPERYRQIHLGHRRNYARNAHPRPMGVDLDLYALHKDGTELPVEISLSPIHDGGRQLVAAALRDVTERKRIQTELMQAREAAERANLAKSRFLATASHDLRQPLQTLSLLNGTLRRIVREPMASEAVAQQGQAIDAMSRLTNALLDISKLESGAIRPDPGDFAVAGLFEEMRKEFASVAASKGLELRIEAAAPSAHSDPSLVGQILRNLLSNAIKYTQRGWVRLRSAPSPAGGVCLEVTDSGIGIPADHLPYIYDEFYQVGVASNTSREGYGLGLSIVQRLVRLLGLKLEVRSEVGHGSTFMLEMPAGAREAGQGIASAPAAIPAEARPACARILLVDDDAGVRNATAMLLRVEGFEVLCAASLAEANEALSKDPRIDVVIADYHLQKGETGIDVIAAARGVAGERLGAVLVSGDTSSTLRDVKASDRLRIASKPIRADELLSLVTELLSVSRDT
ncbi:MAG: PAS domain S-box protein [Gammaproteobacteria bacterium]|nr:PAS domain S-box protein [Gammaproteobacteria bacterium]